MLLRRVAGEGMHLLGSVRCRWLSTRWRPLQRWCATRRLLQRIVATSSSRACNSSSLRNNDGDTFTAAQRLQRACRKPVAPRGSACGSRTDTHTDAALPQLESASREPSRPPGCRWAGVPPRWSAGTPAILGSKSAGCLAAQPRISGNKSLQEGNKEK